jgi:signal transduction histidine kinase/CheY-like chemotaxis protein
VSATTNHAVSAAHHRWVSLLLMISTVLIVISFIAAGLASTAFQADNLDNLHWTIAYATAAILAWQGVRQADATTRITRRWFAYGLSLNLGGQLCWDLQTLLQLTAYPSLSDFLFLSLGPCCVWGLWRSVQQQQGRSLNWPLLVDATTLSVVLLGMVLALYLSHYHSTNRIALMIMVIYPTSMLAGCCLMLVMLLTLRVKLHVDWLLFAAASLLNGLLWLHWIYLSQTDTLQTQRWLYLAFSLVTLVLGVGAMRWRISSSADVTLKRRYELCLHSLPLLTVGMAAIGVALAVAFPRALGNATLAVYISAVLVLVLTMIRQSLLLFERERLLAIELHNNELQQDLQLMAERLNLATGAAGIGVFEYQYATGTLLWDQQMHRLYGTQPQNFGGTLAEWQRCLHPDEGQTAIAEFNLAARNALVVHNHADFGSSFRIVRPDGSIRYIESRADIQYDAHGQPVRVVGINWDITARQEAELSRARLEAQLRQSQKLQAIGTLASGIAHDFNNILGAILGNTELALQDTDVHHPARASVLEIRSAGQRGRDLIRRIVTFGKPHELNFRVAALSTVIEDTLKLVRATLPATVEIHCALPAELPPVRVDSAQIAQLLLNLCSNAYQAMRLHKGRIDIGLSAHEFVDAASLPDRDMQAGRYVCLQVGDTGSGVAANIAERIFEPFFTTKAVGEGSGLGLSIVHNIVRNHAGFIVLDSQPGEGANFRIYLPVAAAQRQAEPVVVVAGKNIAPGCGQHILYLDDEESLVFLTTRMLERFGYRVSGFTDAGTALHAILAKHADFDLIISDHSMPVMSGMDLAQEILSHQPDARIMLVSGYLPPREIEQALNLGIKAVILKPDTVDELAATVHRLLATPSAHPSRQTVQA